MKILLTIAAIAVLLFMGLGLAYKVSREDEGRSFEVSDIAESRVTTSEFERYLTKVTTVTNSNGSTTTSVQAAGVTILLPVEKKSPTEVMTSASGDGKFSYSSSSVNVSIDGGKLTVDGKDYGTSAAGDKVDLRNKGKVLVNGAERQAVAP